MKLMRIAVLVALGAAVVALAGVGRPEVAGGASTPAGGITVNGIGTISSVPNEAQFSMGVQSKGATAREALASNSKEMQRVIAALKSGGVAKDDIQTQSVSVSPSYGSDGQTDGYSAGNTVSVTIHDLSKAGAILDAASSAGAKEVYGPTLSRSNQDALQAKALREAVGNARKKAEALAGAAGVRLGSVTAITEGSSGGGPEPYFADARLAKSDQAAPIEPGTQDVQATVTVTFAIG
ncbi:MAG: SIMPL domain-containing protein [Actinomycetota bacterium]